MAPAPGHVRVVGPPASARVEGRALCSSILPWRGCGTGAPWSEGTTAEKTPRCLDGLGEGLRPDGVWGGDWNHALMGPETAGSMAGRLAVQRRLVELDLQVPTAELPHQIDGLHSTRHIAVPGTWRVLSAERISATDEGRRLSGYDAYVVDVVPDVTADSVGEGSVLRP